MTDRQTDRQTEFSSPDRVCISCSAVKNLYKLVEVFLLENIYFSGHTTNPTWILFLSACTSFQKLNRFIVVLGHAAYQLKMLVKRLLVQVLIYENKRIYKTLCWDWCAFKNRNRGMSRGHMSVFHVQMVVSLHGPLFDLCFITHNSAYMYGYSRRPDKINTSTCTKRLRLFRRFDDFHILAVKTTTVYMQP